MLGHEPTRTAQDSPGREGASGQHLGPAGDSLKLHEVSSGLRKPRTQVGGPRTWFHQTAMALYSPAMWGFTEPSHQACGCPQGAECEWWRQARSRAPCGWRRLWSVACEAGCDGTEVSMQILKWCLLQLGETPLLQQLTSCGS